MKSLTPTPAAMILTKERFSELWNALVEQPLEVSSDRANQEEITNGVSSRLASFLTTCANGDDTCLADSISEV